MNEKPVRLLIKVRGGDARNFSLGLGTAGIGFSSEPLFAHLPGTSAGQRGIAGDGQWRLATVNAGLGLAEAVNPWDLCHQALTQGLGVDGTEVLFAEPDIEQRWNTGDDNVQIGRSLNLAGVPEKQDQSFPHDNADNYWFRDGKHSQLQAARKAVGDPADRVRIAHFDTGYDPAHTTLPRRLDRNLQANFVELNGPGSAVDQTSGFLTNLGHGTGTLGILAGNKFQGSDLGGAPNAAIVPVRVANSVVLFSNSSIARAMDYVFGLCKDERTRVHVVTMSMGGLASQAWAEAVNQLYDAGVFMVTAAGNNFGNIPTRFLVYPARFKRVVAACGVMCDGKPYADLGPFRMAGNYGPDRLMGTALAAYTPNTPWAKIHDAKVVDFDGRGTSSATPQIAAAAALWIQKHKAQWDAYPAGWMKVEAVRAALFESAQGNGRIDRHFGRGLLQADVALGVQPKASTTLRKAGPDDAAFALIRGLGGLGAGRPDNRQQMLELEALQLSQRSADIEGILAKAEAGGDRDTVQRRLGEALLADAGASQALREALGAGMSARTVRAPRRKPAGLELRRIQRAMQPTTRIPAIRRVRVFTFDPLMNTDLSSFKSNQATIELPWEQIGLGPVDDYLEVIDVDPASNACYQPVDPNDPAVLAEAGLERLESDPQFHQLMAYAVARKTIEHFEQALGRVALWSPRRLSWEEPVGGGKTKRRYDEQFVRRLRIYPHAMREANAYYSPDKKALLFGYCNASEDAGRAGLNLPGGLVFTCLSYDIVAHETAHALLDGLHRRYVEATNADMLAFHEAFADIVAMFQHFTHPEVLREEIARTGSRLDLPGKLANLAQQFGQAIGERQSLRTALDFIEDEETKEKRPRRLDDVGDEPHQRGSILVAAVFEAFTEIYRARTSDLLRVAGGGTGGPLHPDLVDRLAREASKAAEHVLRMVIRALDYCPPVSLTFGDFLRAIITGDFDVQPIDSYGYRVAFVSAFRRRRIYPNGVRSLSPDSLKWEQPEAEVFNIQGGLEKLDLGWKLKTDRREAYYKSRHDAALLRDWLATKFASKELGRDERLENAELLGFSLRIPAPGSAVRLCPFEVHSVRPAFRISPDGRNLRDVIVELTQKSKADGRPDLRGGATWVVDGETGNIRYCVRKRADNPDRIAEETRFRAQQQGLSANYFDHAATVEPFAMIHRGD